MNEGFRFVVDSRQNASTLPLCKIKKNDTVREKVWVIGLEKDQ